MDVKERLDAIYEKLEERVDKGELTEEAKDVIFTEAVIKYCSEYVDEDEYTYESIKDDRENANGVMKHNKLDEVIHDKAEDAKRGIKAFAQMYDKSQEGLGHEKIKFIVDKKEFKKLSDLEHKLRSELNFSKYKKYFEEFRKRYHMKAGSLNLRFIDKEKLADGKYAITLKYRIAPKKIKLPEGYKLFHYSNFDNLTKLYPTFKGKKLGENGVPHMNGGGYLYSYPRIYFLIRPGDSKITGYDKMKVSVSRTAYVADTPIHDVYVDPNRPTTRFTSGAVYIETLYPIKVRKYVPIKEEKPKKDDKDTD